MQAGQDEKKFYADLWLFMKNHKDIEFDEDGLSTDAYWEQLNKDAIQFTEHLYPTEYSKKMMIHFINEMYRRAQLLEMPYRIIKEQKMSFSKNSPEWDFYGKYVAFTQNHMTAPVLLPDHSNDAEVNGFWQEARDEAKKLSEQYGELAKNMLLSFLDKVEREAEENAMQYTGTQMTFLEPDGYEELSFC